MEALKNILSQNWVGTLVGIIGLFTAYIFFRRSQASPQPVYQTRGLGLVGGSDPALPGEVEIRFQGHVVPRVSKTQVVFWNAGRATIRGEDIVKSDPLRLVFGKDAKVLRVRILLATRETLDFRAEARTDPQNEAQFSFDYLDSGDGGVIEIIHTSEELHPEVVGTIRGIPMGVQNWGRVYHRSPTFLNPRSRVASYVMIIVGGLAAAVGFLSIWLSFRPLARLANLEAWALIPVGGFYLVAGVLFFWFNRRRFPRALVIKELME